MTVFAVMSGFYDAYGLERVFSTRERADEYARKGAAKGIHEWSDYRKSGYFEIVEMEVDSTENE